MISRYAIVESARRRVGLRWRHQARTDGVACDCYGLLLIVALENGVQGAEEAAADFDLHGYGREPDYAMGLAKCREYLIEVPKAQAYIGDVLYMRVPKGVHPQHFAIQTERDGVPYMVHAWAESRGVVENRIDDVWRSRIVHVFRFKDVA